MQNIAQAWLVYRLTESSFWLGVVAFCSLVPVFLFGLFGGLLADRYDKRKLLIVLHSLALLQSLLFALLVFFGLIQLWHIVFLALFLGVVHAFEMPLRHTFIVSLVPKSEVGNAIALNSSAFNSARFTGPALAGVVISVYSEALVFLINSITFAAILLALYKIKSIRGSSFATSGILHGLKYAFSNLTIRYGLFIVATMSLVASSITVLMPVYAAQIYQGDSGTLGYLMGALGIGALTGALRLAWHKQVHHLDRQPGRFGLLAGLFLGLFAGSSNLELSLVILAVIGYCQTTLVASTNTLIQLNVEDALRGRVMALYSVLFIGLMPVGSLIAGIIADYLTVRFTSLVFAGFALVASAYYLHVNRAAVVRVG